MKTLHQSTNSKFIIILENKDYMITTEEKLLEIKIVHKMPELIYGLSS